MRYITLQLLATISLTTIQAADKLSLKDLARYEGVWESSPKQSQDGTTIGYNEHRILSDIGVKQQIHLEVDQKSREIVGAYIAFLAPNPGGGDFSGLGFSSDGWITQSFCVPAKDGFIAETVYTGTNGMHMVMLTQDDFVSEGEMRGSTKNIIGGGTFTPEGDVSVRKRLKAASLHDLIDNKLIVTAKWDNRSPGAGLAPLARLLGHWQLKSDQNRSGLDCRFEYRGGKQWIVERWKFTDGQAGINVSGVDPLSGDLALWSIGKEFIGRSGGWDTMGDSILGQIQGNARLVRKFPDAKTFDAHWQQLTNGSYVDMKDSSYTSKRID